MNNMMMFDADGKITKFESPLDILSAFGQVRLRLYSKRKEYFLAKLQRESEILSERARFIRHVLRGEIKVKRRRIYDLIQDLLAKNFKPLKDIKGPEDEKAQDPVAAA